MWLLEYLWISEPSFGTLANFKQFGSPQYKILLCSIMFERNALVIQGGHGTGKTGKTGNLVPTFSRQGKHREFCCNTGKIFETQGKYFDCIYHCNKHVSIHIFSISFSLASLGILSSFRSLFLILFLPVYLLSYFLSISHWLQSINQTYLG